MLRFIKTLFVIMTLAVGCLGQTPSSPFAATTVSFNLTQVTLPGTSQGTLAGAETDVLFPLTVNNIFGETSLIGNSVFVGGRYNRIFPSIANYLQNHTALTGANFQFGLTSSLGVVKTSGNNHWGGRTGVFLNYAPAGSTSFNLGFEVQANYLPGYNGPASQHWIPSIAVGPNFRF